MKQSKKNLNPIPSTMRGKKRYIKFSLQSGKPLKERQVQLGVWQHFLERLGALEAAKQRFQFIGFDEKNSWGIVRCSHNKVEQAKQALLEIKEISGIQVKARIIRVSGTIRKLLEKSS